MDWIKITEENKPKNEVKIAFMTNHILYPDNVYFGIRSVVSGNFYNKGQIFPPDMVTHYLYVEKPTEDKTSEKEALNIGNVSVSLPIESFDADEFLNTKDIYNHPYISDRNNKNGYEVASLMAEFANSIIQNER